MQKKKKTLSKEELIKRLKAISVEDIPAERNMGAMCYESMPPAEATDTCDLCGKSIRFIDWRNDDIQEIVKKIVNLGYDAKIETLCRECCDKVKEELYPGINDEIKIDEEHQIWVPSSERNFLFYFRTNETEPYHRAIARNEDYYKALLSFLQGKSSYRDYYDCDNFLAEEIYVLEFMTGLKIDE